MLDSIALYAGGAAAVAGAVALVPRRTRRKGLALLGGGIAVAALALFWPVTEERAAATVSRLDEAMPRWQFREVHEIRVDADPQRVYDAIHAVRADEIALFNALTWIRRGGRKLPEGILNAGKTKSLLDVATQTSFRYLADDVHEIVVITRIAPGVDAAMNFLITPDGRGAHVTTETRVFAGTARGARLFAGYWRVIHPGSDIIRRSWLRAIKRRAEA
ncbi:MAG TPA: hypothetical protein VG323_19185 [Thermoanaerobaculia bacterium]|nr:hypothetical protein [Thermoanaerobaculia bacterium]